MNPELKMHLNAGRALSRPYESGYSVFRRFLIANPTLTKALINKYLKDSNVSLYSFINKIIKQNICHNNQTLENYNSRYHLLNTPIYHCATCAQQGYHSDLFYLPWLTECPIHHAPLTSTCPLCKQPWPSCSDMLNNTCPGCGRTIDKTKLPILKSFNDVSLYDPIIKLSNFIYYDKENNVNLESSFVNLYNHHSEISPFNQNFPSFQVCRNLGVTQKSLRKMVVTTFSKFHKKQFRIHEVDKVEFNYIAKSIMPSWISKERNSALLLITNHIKRATAKNHQLEILDFALIEKRELERMMPLCPYCVAFSLWFYRITGSGYDYRITRRNPFANLIEEYSNYSPFRPFPSDYFVRNKRYFKTSLNFQKWLYQRDLQATFINIFNESMRIQNEYEIGKVVAIDESEDFMSSDELYLDQSLYFSCNTDKMKIYTYHQSKYLLNEKTLPKIHGASTHCKKFKQQLEKTYLKNELKHNNNDTTYINGLNYEEYLVLEHGLQSEYNPHTRISHFFPSNAYISLT